MAHAFEIEWGQVADALYELALSDRDLAAEIGQIYMVIGSLDDASWTGLPRVQPPVVGEDLRWFRAQNIVCIMRRRGTTIEVLEGAIGHRPYDFDRAVNAAKSRLEK